jgi:hypothetical protein
MSDASSLVSDVAHRGLQIRGRISLSITTGRPGHLRIMSAAGLQMTGCCQGESIESVSVYL